ncbi:MAG: ribbon-helix-helix protein, CopG family [Pirellulales bacterium]|nr:ribbon-helix-helix protein, CopG family [Pirellulales bacterium]
MTVTIPKELETALQQKADERKTSMGQLVREALEWYLRMDAELLDELTAWQEVRDEALDVVDGSSP